MEPPSSTDNVLGRTVFISNDETSPTASRHKKIPTLWKLILKNKHLFKEPLMICLLTIYFCRLDVFLSFFLAVTECNEGQTNCHSKFLANSFTDRVCESTAVPKVWTVFKLLLRFWFTDCCRGSVCFFELHYFCNSLTHSLRTLFIFLYFVSFTQFCLTDIWHFSVKGDWIEQLQLAGL